jgi:hypothetical protein
MLRVWKPSLCSQSCGLASGTALVEGGHRQQAVYGEVSGSVSGIEAMLYGQSRNQNLQNLLHVFRGERQVPSPG